MKDSRRDSGHTDLQRPQSPRSQREIYDAYLVFCEHGCNRVAWRSLSVALTLFLETKSSFASGGIRTAESGRQPKPSRVEYLAELDFDQLGFLVEDVLRVLFWGAGLIPPEHDGFSELENVRKTEQIDADSLIYNEIQRIDKRGQLVRSYLSTLSLHQLQLLLVDITDELNKRAPFLYCTLRFSSTWNPRDGTTTGVLSHVPIHVDKVAAHLIAWPQRIVVTTLAELPGALPQRTLGTRGGSEKRRSKTILSLDKIISRLLPSKQIFRIRPYEPSTKDSDSAIPLEAAPFPETLASTDPGKTPTSKMIALPTLLKTIMEVNNEDEDRGEGDEARNNQDTVYSDQNSTMSAEAFDGLADFFKLWLAFWGDSSTEPTDQLKDGFDAPGGFETFQQLLRSPLVIGDGSSIASMAGLSQSSTSTRLSFKTAQTHISGRVSTKATVRSSVATFLSIETANSHNKSMVEQTAYWKMLKERDLLPEAELENDWSGRGQHVQFDKTERDHIPLRVEKLLGQTGNARVESVRCRRVRLVRKLMRCNKWSGLKREDVLLEVQHLYRVKHSHIVRLVGTYVIGQELAILTYPCAEWNLEQFMEYMRSGENMAVECTSLRQFFTCLAKVLDFLHSYPLKHMDIKPQNLLVRDVRTSAVNDAHPFKIYLTDFGISRSYDTIEASETENPTAYTRTYAAREVVLQESRGLSADVFSLGCVFAEMLATVLDASSADEAAAEEPTSTQWSALTAARSNADMELRPYYSTNTAVCAFLYERSIHEPELETVRTYAIAMLDSNPSRRPTARELSTDPRLPFACLSCTLHMHPEKFEAAEPLTPHPDLIEAGCLEVPTAT